MKQTLVVWLLYQLPEAIMMLFCGTRLLGLRPVATKMCLASLIFGICVPLARVVFPFGWHTFVLFAAYVLIAKFVFTISVQTGLTAATAAFFLLTLGDPVVMQVLAIKKLSVNSLIATLPGQLLVGYLSASFLVFATLAIILFRIRLISAPEALSSAPVK